ncbi:hypothetical protein AAMO2058_001462000 [Amorphochlora amoebiformis]
MLRSLPYGQSQWTLHRDVLNYLTLTLTLTLNPNPNPNPKS